MSQRREVKLALSRDGGTDTEVMSQQLAVETVSQWPKSLEQPRDDASFSLSRSPLRAPSSPPSSSRVRVHSRTSDIHRVFQKSHPTVAKSNWSETPDKREEVCLFST